MEDTKIVQLHWIGRLGNRMFQYAFGCQYAFSKRIMYYYPSEWEGTVLFKPFLFAQKIPDDHLTQCFINSTDSVAERKKCLYKDYKDVEVVDFHHYEGHGVNIAFDDISMMFFKKGMQQICTDFLRRTVFAFSDLVKGTQMYMDLESRKQTYVVAHIRRGDIVSKNYSGGHCAVTLSSYQNKLLELGVDESSVIWLSEDRSIGTRHKWTYDGSAGWTYPCGSQKINDETVFEFLPDLLTIYFAKTILRGNSGFSWWAAELSQADVYSPVVPMRPANTTGPAWVDCNFKHDNTPNFMGSGYDDIQFRQTCNHLEMKYIDTISAYNSGYVCVPTTTIRTFPIPTPYVVKYITLLISLILAFFVTMSIPKK